ncbi:MAG: DUF4491 family protein [Rikenellaceae bacterium]
MFNFMGIAIGISTFLVIGLFHPAVVKGYYYFGVRCWWCFLLIGIIGILLSLLISNIFFSTLMGVVAFSSLWTIKELFEQRDRVRKGWFPANPNNPE